MERTQSRPSGIFASLTQVNQFRSSSADALNGLAGREEHDGEFVGFSSGNAEAQCVAGKAWMKPVLVAQGDDFGRHFRPVFRVSKIMDEKKVAFEAGGIEPAKQGGDNSGLEIQAFPERPFFKLGGRTGEAFAEK